MTPWDQAKESVGYAGRIIVWLIILLAVVMVLFGCAQKPICQKFSLFMAMNHQGQPLYIADEANLAILAKTMEGLSKGECRLED